MKKLLLILPLAMLMACSTDDDSTGGTTPPVNNNWRLNYTDACGGAPTGYLCMTEAEYNDVMETKYWIDETCFKVRAKDASGQLQFYTFHSGVKGCQP